MVHAASAPAELTALVIPLQHRRGIFYLHITPFHKSSKRKNTYLQISFFCSNISACYGKYVAKDRQTDAVTYNRKL